MFLNEVVGKLYTELLTFHLSSWYLDGTEWVGSVASLDSVYIYIEVKAVPFQAWSGPEDSRKLRFPDFMTTAGIF
jgi:hypothetical protein